MTRGSEQIGQEFRGRIEGIDLLRGLAIALVLVRHSWPEALGNAGIAGVVMFFALSGYLITGILARDIHKSGRVRYGHFYRNRAIRLIPALVFMLIGLVVVTAIWDPLGERDGLLRAVVVGLTYTGNLPFDHGSSAIGHLWTLATEEQFYLVWPLVLAVGITRKKIGLLLTLAATAIILALIASLIISAPATNKIYQLPSSWALAMVIGAAARIYQDRIVGWLPGPGRSRTLLSWLMIVGLLAISLLPEAKESPLTYLIVGPAVALMSLVLLFHLRTWATLPFAWLRPGLALGTISYAAYLWNYPIVMWMGERPLDPTRAIGAIILTLAAATVSWWLVEKPFNKWKSRLDARGRSRADAPMERVLS